jgi:very-short-patch-repair endonuclease
MKGWSRKHIKKDKVIGDLPDSYLLFEKLITDRIGKPVREHRFHPERMWRFDFSYPDVRLAVEIEGLVHNGFSRHTTISGFEEDAWKYAEATLLGWTVIRFSQNQIKTIKCLDLIEKIHNRLNNSLV